MTDYISMYNRANRNRWEDAEIERLIRRCRRDATYLNGIMRWNSNDSVPPQDIVDLAAHLGFPVNAGACREVRDYEMEETLREYRKNYTGPSDEERAEARAAHGSGVELVNMLTGHTWTT